jgi:hypothetical protein
MDNGNETLGLRVVTTKPEAHMANVNVNSKIEITFSSDVNPATLQKSIIVFEDYKNVYTGVTSLKDSNNFNTVKGTVTYADRILVFTPQQQLNVNTRYIVMLNNSIKDIVGNMMLSKFVFAFSTELVKSYGKSEFVAPDFGSICETIPEISWKNQQSESYIFQMSKMNTFETLLHENFVVGSTTGATISYTPNVQLAEGIYYARVKSEGGEWSNPLQFFFKEITDAVVAQEDASESIYLEDFLNDLEEPLEVLEFFPSQNSLNISLKTNIIYIKIKGKVDAKSFNINNCLVFGSPFDEEDDIGYSHGTVDGTWNVVYDKLLDLTYIIFEPVAIN